MKRFAIASALALALAAGNAGKADAQYVYGYSTINPYTGSIVNTQAYYTPFAAQAVTGYYNPWTGMSGQRMMYQNAWGTALNRGYGYNPYLGTGYLNGSYYPGFGVSPLYGGYYRYRW